MIKFLLESLITDFTIAAGFAASGGFVGAVNIPALFTGSHFLQEIA
jgi:hypothetical protein